MKFFPIYNLALLFLISGKYFPWSNNNITLEHKYTCKLMVTACVWKSIINFCVMLSCDEIRYFGSELQPSWGWNRGGCTWDFLNNLYLHGAWLSLYFKEEKASREFGALTQSVLFTMPRVNREKLGGQCSIEAADLGVSLFCWEADTCKRKMWKLLYF